MDANSELQNGSAAGRNGNMGTVARAVAILKCVAESPKDVSVKGLADQLSLAPSTVHRLLHLLMGEGLIERSDSGHLYKAGVEYFRIGSLIANKAKIPDIALPYMRELVDECDEFCLLFLYLPTEMKVMVAQTVASRYPLGYQSDLYETSSLAWGASGRSVLAFLPEDEIRAIYDASGASPSDGRPLPPYADFSADLAAIRARGYAHTSSQKIPGAVGMGAPLYGANGKVVGSLCLTTPEIRFKPENQEILGARIVRQANRLSHALGSPIEDPNPAGSRIGKRG